MFKNYSIEYLKTENPDNIFELCNKDEQISSMESDMFYQVLEKYIITHTEINNERYRIINETLEDILYLMETCEEYGTFFQHIRSRVGAYSIWLTYTKKQNEKKLTLKRIIDNIISNISDKGNVTLANERYEKCIKDINKINDISISDNIIWFYENHME